MFGGPDRDRTDDLFHAIIRNQPKLLTDNHLLAGITGKTGILGSICCQNATNSNGRIGLHVGGQSNSITLLRT